MPIWVSNSALIAFASLRDLDHCEIITIPLWNRKFLKSCWACLQIGGISNMGSVLLVSRCPWMCFCFAHSHRRLVRLPTAPLCTCKVSKLPETPTFSNNWICFSRLLFQLWSCFRFLFPGVLLQGLLSWLKKTKNPAPVRHLACLASPLRPSMSATLILSLICQGKMFLKLNSTLILNARVSQIYRINMEVHRNSRYKYIQLSAYSNSLTFSYQFFRSLTR